jgi:hypothetical protein
LKELLCGFEADASDNNTNIRNIRLR